MGLAGGVVASFLIIGLLSIPLVLFFPIGPIFAFFLGGLIGGFVAKGAGRGFLAGFIGGIIGAVISAIIITSAGAYFLGRLGATTGGIIGGTIVLIFFFMSLFSGIGGAIGGAMNKEQPKPVSTVQPPSPISQKPEPPSVEILPEERPAIVEEKRITCPNCGKLVTAMRYCLHCGAKLPRITPPEKEELYQLDRPIVERNETLTLLENLKKRLVEGKISEETYKELRKEFEERIKQIDEKLERVREEELAREREEMQKQLESLNRQLVEEKISEETYKELKGKILSRLKQIEESSKRDITS